jgi:lipocalin
MISFNKIIKTWVFVSLGYSSLVTAALLDKSFQKASEEVVTEPMFEDGEGGENEGPLCKIPDAVENFNLEAFTDATWYIQEASTTAFISEKDSCISVQYDILDTPNSQGWTIEISTDSENRKGHDNPAAELCAIQDEKFEEMGKFKVGKCFLPPTTVPNNYFVLAFKDEAPAYALVAAGSQGIVGVPNCGCAAPTGGLFIFTRDSERDEAVIDEVREIAKDLGYGLCDLFTVDQEDC